MASDKEYVRYVLEQLSGLEEISTRAMMGEYILYYRGKVAGGIYDNRLLIKPVRRQWLNLRIRSTKSPIPAPEKCCWLTGWTTGNF